MIRTRCGPRRVGTITAFCVAAALLPASSTGLAAQERGEGWARCAADSGASSIRGRLVAQADSIPGRPALSLDGDPIGEHCWVMAAEDGTFEFRELPPGRYEIDLASLGYLAAPPLEIELAADTTVYLVIPLYERDILRECMHAPSCAEILSRRTAPERAGTERALRITAYRVALIVAGGGWDAEPDWVACVDRDETAAASALAEVFTRIGDAADCEPEPRRFQRSFAHEPSGRPARLLYVHRITMATDHTATVSLSYAAGNLWGAAYRCAFERLGDVWTARSCVLVAVS